jgi:exodeoxyribonuclease V alpha subunit
VLAIVRERIPKRLGLDPIRDIQVLCPMNRGGLGARSLNIELQKALNPPGAIRIERFGWTFCPGDKVMQAENDYDKDVYNGDLGVVSGIDIEEGELAVDFMAATSPTALASSTSWCWPMRRRFTRARARNTRPSSSH